MTIDALHRFARVEFRAWYRALRYPSRLRAAYWRTQEFLRECQMQNDVDGWRRGLRHRDRLDRLPFAPR